MSIGILPRANGRKVWYVQVMVQGRSYKKSFPFDQLEQAQAWEDQIFKEQGYLRYNRGDVTELQAQCGRSITIAFGRCPDHDTCQLYEDCMDLVADNTNWPGWAIKED